MAVTEIRAFGTTKKVMMFATANFIEWKYLNKKIIIVL